MYRNFPLIEHLLRELKSIELGKMYLEVVYDHLEQEEARIALHQLQKQRINNRLENLAENWLSRLLPKAKAQQKAEQESLQFKQMEIDHELEKCLERIEDYHFRLEVIHKNIEREDQLYQQLLQQILERQTEILSGGHPHQKETLGLVQQLDQAIGAKKEIEEILQAGVDVISIVKELLIHISHKLVRNYSTLKYEKRHDPGYSGLTVICKSTLEEIKQLALDLRENLEELEVEMREVYNNDEIDLIGAHQKRKYFQKLYGGEMLVKELLKKQLGSEQQRALKDIQEHVQSINQIFQQEATALEQQAHHLQEEINALLRLH